MENRVDTTIREVKTNRFIIDFEMGRRLVAVIEPEAIVNTTKSFTIRNFEGVTYLEAYNASNVMEYAIELNTDSSYPPQKSNYKETLEEVIGEQKIYNRITLTGNIIMASFILICLFIIMYIRSRTGGF